MGSLFSRPKAVKAPPLPAPQAIPQEDSQSSDAAYRKMYSKGGYMNQFKAGPLTPASTGKRTLLA